MKKPAVGETDKLRVLTEDPELRTLMEQYYSAPAGEREPILEAFNEKAEELHPDWRETVERAKRDGVMLRALFIHTLKEARARRDLTEFEQFKIKNLEAEFVTIFDTLSVASPDAERAVKLALAVQEMEMIARLGLEEAERRKLRAMSEGGQKGGIKSGKTRGRENKPWAPHATELARVIYSELPDPSDEDVAVEIKTRWKLEDLPPPSVRTLVRFMPELRPAGSEASELRGQIVSDTKGASCRTRRGLRCLIYAPP
jgi:hypothetical protein